MWRVLRPNPVSETQRLINRLTSRVNWLGSLKVIRILVTTLLLGAIIAGFTRGLWVEEASGVITSYSTWTSVAYSVFLVTRSIEYKNTAISVSSIAGRAYLAQYGADGPCVQVTWDIVTRDFCKLTIRNVMNTRVKSGSLSGSLIGFLGTQTGTQFIVTGMVGNSPFTVDFDSINVGESLQIGINIPRSLALSEFVTVGMGDVGIYLDEGVKTVVGLQAIRTFSSISVWSTVTYAYPMTRTFTIEEPLLAGTSTIWLLLILGGVGAIVAILFQRRKKRPAVV